MRIVTTGLVAIAVLLSGVPLGRAASPDAWTRSVERGSVYYTCRSSDCGGQALISCRVVGGNAITSTDQFAARVRSQIEALRAADRKVVQGESRSSRVGARVLHQTAYSVEVPGTPGPEHFRTGFLVGASETFSIVSSSPGAATTRRNFDRFVAGLVSRPSATSVGDCLP